MSNFAGTAAVVTGASGGIGQAIAIALADAGVDRLLVHYRSNLVGAKQTAAEVAALGAEASLVQADLADSVERQRLIDTGLDQFGPIQTWVNNAGADVLTGDAANWNFSEKLHRLIDVDLLGTIELSRIVAQRMVVQSNASPPSISFIGWDQAARGMEGDAGQMFGTVKAGLMAFAASLAQTVAPDVRVNTIAPGWIKTAWGEQADSYWNNRAANQALMARWGEPDDVARAVVYVADPTNSFLTGQTIDVNGGWNRRYSVGEATD